MQKTLLVALGILLVSSANGARGLQQTAPAAEPIMISAL